jgi:hypothetical protein
MLLYVINKLYTNNYFSIHLLAKYYYERKETVDTLSLNICLTQLADHTFLGDVIFRYLLLLWSHSQYIKQHTFKQKHTNKALSF